ncbi:MAG: putative ABC transport system permease protein [Verrucomicrobiales bacterium]|jgi:putative ABC transport system permease protein
MKLSRMVTREISHRKGSFLLSLLGVSLAVACVVATFGLLQAHKFESAENIEKHDQKTVEILAEHDRKTEGILADHDKKTETILTELETGMEEKMAKLEDEVRKSMKGLGFNIYIFPAGQDLSEVYAEGFASKTMPEEFVTTLANSKIVTVNHLLPSLTQKLTWEEHQRTVILIGIRGEVPLAHRDPKAPLIDPVAPGKLVLGYELHNSLGLEEGAKIVFQGQNFEVAKAHPARGTKDDITIWMNLAEAQQLLDKPGEINAIQALECNCATIDRLGEIRAELTKILPGTQIIETESTALARAEARNLAKATALKTLEDTRRDQGRIRSEQEQLLVGARAEQLELAAGSRAEQVQLAADSKGSLERFASVVLPVVTLAGMAWIGLLALTNVRDRVTEIGILRAVGVKGGKIFSAFLTRSALAGFIGAGIGLVAFLGIFPAVSAKYFAGRALGDLIDPALWVVPLIAAPLLAVAAAWLPAMAAAQKDPASILRQD